MLDFAESHKVKAGLLYECSNVTIFGTAYKRNQFVILPSSKKTCLLFGKIEKILCCEEYGYILYRHMTSQFCEKTDLHFVRDTELFDVTPIAWLKDPRPLEVKRNCQ